jgi:hypothetical protein
MSLLLLVLVAVEVLPFVMWLLDDFAAEAAW